MIKMNVAEEFEKMLEGIPSDVLEEEVLLLTETLDAQGDPDSISETALYKAAEQRANEVRQVYGLPQAHISMPPLSYGTAAQKRKPNIVLIAVIVAIAVLLAAGVVVGFLHFTKAPADAAQNDAAGDAVQEEQQDPERQEGSDAAAAPTPAAPADTADTADAQAGEVLPTDEPAVGADGGAAEGGAEQDGQQGESETVSPDADGSDGQYPADESGAGDGALNDESGAPAADGANGDGGTEGGDAQADAGGEETQTPDAETGQ